MATLDTTDDLLRAARENSEFREAFRREILTEELLAVPDDLTELKAVTANIAATGEALLEHADVTNQRLENMVDGITALVQGMADYKTATENRLVEISGNFPEVQTSIVRVENMLSEQEQAQSSFRGTYAQSAASEEDMEIAGMFAGAHGLDVGLIETMHIRRRTLREWSVTHRDALLTLDLKQSNPLGKFCRPDIVAAITDATDEDATPVYYLAVEASYSGEKKGIDKATDNAKILRAITGLKVYPVVAAVRLHHRMDDETRNRLYEDVTDFIEADNPDTAFWYKIDSDDMRPPEPR